MTSGVVHGQFLSWDGGCLFLSRATVVTPMHAHYAIQLAFGSAHGIRFRAGDREPWGEYGGVVIPSRQPHTMDATVVEHNAVLFVEPETREGRAIHERHVRQAITPMPEEVLAGAGQALFASWLGGRSRSELTEAARRLVRDLAGNSPPFVRSDERILRAIRYVNDHLGGPLTLDEVAAEACLSPSRFRHLFVEQTGMALRPYILWRRFLKVWDLLMDGAQLSGAAHAAGFADAAHLTRTCRRMFGLAPSTMQMMGRKPVAVPPDAYPSPAEPAAWPRP